MKRGILIDNRDNVGIVLERVKAGEQVEIGGRIIKAIESIDLPHKIALRDFEPGESVIKYGAVIGYATEKIKAGQHVHIHNLDSERLMK